MVRTTTPLVERMTLVWHDWFATSNSSVASQQLMLGQNELFRANALGSFDTLLRGRDDRPGDAGLALGQPERQGPAERELRPRADGALHARRRPRRLQRGRRPRAGAGADRLARQSADGFTLRTPSSHDAGPKTIFAHDRQLRLAGLVPALPRAPAARLVLRDAAVELLRPDRRPTTTTVDGLVSVYAGRQIRPVVEAILKHPALHTGPRMVKPPVVYNAGLLRTLGRGIDTAAWWQLDQSAGHAAVLPAGRRRLAQPPPARHRHLPRAAGSSRRSRQGASEPTDAPHDPAKLLDARAPVLGLADALGARRAGA